MTDGELFDLLPSWISKHGTTKSGSLQGTCYANVIVYRDDLVVLTRDTTTLRMEIILRETDNPVLMTDGLGQVFRYNGEFAYVRDHLKDLVLCVS